MKSKILGVGIALGVACSVAHAQSMQEQAQCAAQARVAANQENSKWEQTSSGMQTISFDHESHFNKKLNKCFIVTRRTFNVASILHWNTNLYDAFEGRDYALFMRSDRNPHKPMFRRRSSGDMAVQFAWSRVAVSAQRACSSGLGLQSMLEGVRLLLRVGYGGVPQGRFAGALPEVDRQVRSILSARVPNERRSVSAVRASVGVMSSGSCDRRPPTVYAGVSSRKSAFGGRARKTFAVRIDVRFLGRS